MRSPFGTNVNIGVATDLPGLGFLTPGSNQRTGFDIELADWLGLHVNPQFDPNFVDLTIDKRSEALSAGRVQLIIEVFSITDDRRKAIGFAGPYLITRQGIMVRTGDNSIRTVEDLAGKTVCVPSGSTSLNRLRDGPLKGRNLITDERGFTDCVKRLRAGSVDAVSTDQLILHGVATTDPTHLSVSDVTFGEQERYGIGLRHGDAAACKMLTAKVREFIVDGYWGRFFAENFPGLNPSDYKPDPYGLDTCE